MRPLPRIRTARDVREEAAYYTDQSLEAFTVKNVQKSTLVRKLYGVLQQSAKWMFFFDAKCSAWIYTAGITKQLHHRSATMIRKIIRRPKWILISKEEAHF